jgi:hypothetical protein
MLRHLFKMFSALLDPYAWALIIVGGALFAGRVALPQEQFVNLPMLITLFEIVGGSFVICGVALIASRLFWNSMRYDLLLSQVYAGNVAAAILLGAVKVFCGLIVIGFSIWVALSFNGAR